ncbi:hypothetical protein NVIRPANT_00158 [Pantoea sp. Nvir]|nr:hypothetical protein NVIRPANT_00158 [Pantoea sp. Nvir]
MKSKMYFTSTIDYSFGAFKNLCKLVMTTLGLYGGILTKLNVGRT